MAHAMMADRLYKQPDNIVFTWICGNPKGEGAKVILRHKTRVWEDIKEFLMKAVGLPSTREKTLPAADEVAPPFPDATLVTRPKDAPSMVVFKFLEPATTAFYKNDFEAITSFWKSRAKRHCDEIFKWNSWKCVICDKPAKDIVNVYLPQFHPHLEDADAPYKLSPEIVVIASPICFRGSTCDNEAEKVARGIAKGENEPEDDEEHFKKSCDNCGKISGLLACAGCRFTWYCSKECQVACWSVHKKGCKRTQRMMSAAL